MPGTTKKTNKNVTRKESKLKNTRKYPLWIKGIVGGSINMCMPLNYGFWESANIYFYFLNYKDYIDHCN